MKEPETAHLHKLPCDWLQKPLDETELLSVIGTAIRTNNGSENQTASEASGLFVPTQFEGILAFTLTMKSVIQQILEAAVDDIPVLISGETGTGKDLVAN